MFKDAVKGQKKKSKSIFLKEVSCAHQGYIYLIKNTAKDSNIVKLKIVYFIIFWNVIYSMAKLLNILI